MTRKDYKELAEAIKSTLEFTSNDLIASDGEKQAVKWAFKFLLNNAGLEDYMREDNSRFDGERFREACGL